jgi:hypothetical protein
LQSTGADTGAISTAVALRAPAPLRHPAAVALLGLLLFASLAALLRVFWWGDSISARYLSALPASVRWRLRWLLTYPLSNPMPSRPSVEALVRPRLAELLAADADRLASFCGREFGEWSFSRHDGR